MCSMDQRNKVRDVNRHYEWVGNKEDGLRWCRRRSHRSGTKRMSELRSEDGMRDCDEFSGVWEQLEFRYVEIRHRKYATRPSDSSKCSYTSPICEMGSLACGQNRTKGIIPNLARHAKPQVGIFKVMTTKARYEEGSACFSLMLGVKWDGSSYAMW